MSEQIILDAFPLGWCPSYSLQADFSTNPSQALLRMDNLTLDEKGSVRLCLGPTSSGNVGASINSIFAAYMNSKKYRYVYTSSGSILRNYGGSNLISTFDDTIGSGSSSLKAAFLTALGHTICLAGSVQVKDRGDTAWPLTIPQPAAPVVTNLSTSSVNLSNLDGSSNFTNWSNVGGSSFVNTGTSITANATIAIKTTYGSLIDTTNFGSGTGNETDGDLFTFTFSITDDTQLNYFEVELFCSDPGAGPVTDEYYTPPIAYPAGLPDGSYVPPSLSGGNTVAITIPRSVFLRNGTNSSLGWNTIKAAYITFNTFSTVAITFTNFFVATGAVTGDQTYVAVEFNNTGQFIQYSIASAQVSITAAVNFVDVDRSGTACNAQCNGIMFFRNNTTLGQFLLVNMQTSMTYGFTPAPFTDTIPDLTVIENAAVSVVPNVLQFYRTNLPTNIIGAVYFASRVIYLTTSSFFPSYQLDLGTYDSRFTYELNATNSELCLFITKLSVNTFIVATTVDFYQVSGTFNTISTTNADGTITTTQDVNVLPLGISDPAISSSFAEVEGNILYMSSRGPRSMSNGVSSLLNTTLDLLFRGEYRYGFPNAALQPNDTSLMGLVSSGTRIYIAIPFANGTNAILVSTYNVPTPAELRGSNYWRPLIFPAQCLAREQDGTVIYGDSAGNVDTLETNAAASTTFYFLTQMFYGQHPNSTKSLGAVAFFINTGGVGVTVTITGLTESGTLLTYITTISSSTMALIQVDPHTTLIDCIAYQISITGTTTVLDLDYIIVTTVQEYPPLTYYALVPFSNLGKDTLKKVAKWGFVIDTLGSTVTATVTADDTVIASDIDRSAEPQGISTEFWYNNEDIAALDWQLELTAPNGMHFYKFMSPDILQVFPPGRTFDQFGPLDLDMQGIVFGFRIRLFNTGVTFTYDVYDNDTSVWSNSLATTPNIDMTIIDKFPKGINTSVFRMIITSPTVFYRHSLEIEVKTTGKESEQKWVKIGSK